MLKLTLLSIDETEGVNDDVMERSNSFDGFDLNNDDEDDNNNQNEITEGNL